MSMPDAIERIDEGVVEFMTSNILLPRLYKYAVEFGAVYPRTQVQFHSASQSQSCSSVSNHAGTHVVRYEHWRAHMMDIPASIIAPAATALLAIVAIVVRAAARPAIGRKTDLSWLRCARRK